MKRVTLLIALLAFLTAGLSSIPAYYKMEVRTGTIDDMTGTVKDMLTSGGFRVIGEYNPGNQSHLKVIAFTSDELIDLATSVTDRGILGAVMKVGITFYDGKVTVSIVNPEYLFYAYYRDRMDNSSVRSKATTVSNKIVSVMTFEGTEPLGFGGDKTVEQLKKYRYMAGMPRFTAPVELATFSSFDKGVETISNNLAAGKGSTVEVYKMVIEGKQIAVFGVGLADADKGEAHFLPIIGEDNVAAMPYEIVLQGNKATMLHGRFRFALHWPELKMVTFAKIMSSPGDVEDFLKGLVN